MRSVSQARVRVLTPWHEGIAARRAFFLWYCWGMESGILTFDLACVGCGYNLRMLGSLGVCPECGEAVRRSLVESPFAGGTRYLQRMMNAVRQIAIGNMIIAGASIVAIVCSLANLLPFLIAMFILLPFGYWVQVLGVRDLTSPKGGRGTVGDSILRSSSHARLFAILIFIVLYFLVMRNSSFGLILAACVMLIALIPFFSIFAFFLGRRLDAICQPAGFRNLSRVIRISSYGSAAGIGLAFLFLLWAGRILGSGSPLGVHDEKYVFWGVIACYVGVMVSTLAGTIGMFRLCKHFSDGLLVSQDARTFMAGLSLENRAEGFERFGKTD